MGEVKLYTDLVVEFATFAEIASRGYVIVEKSRPICLIGNQYQQKDVDERLLAANKDLDVKYDKIGLLPYKVLDEDHRLFVKNPKYPRADEPEFRHAGDLEVRIAVALKKANGTDPRAETRRIR